MKRLVLDRFKGCSPIRQGTVVLWSNSPCIKSGGWWFKSMSFLPGPRLDLPIYLDEANNSGLNNQLQVALFCVSGV